MSKFIADRQTYSLTPYTGVCGFFFKLNLLLPYSLRLQGDDALDLEHFHLEQKLLSVQKWYSINIGYLAQIRPWW